MPVRRTNAECFIKIYYNHLISIINRPAVYMESRIQLSGLTHTHSRHLFLVHTKMSIPHTHTHMQLLVCSLGAWILTNGLRFGITKHLGQAVRDHSLASTSSKVRVVAIGIAPWNMIHNREALLAAKVPLHTQAI